MKNELEKACSGDMVFRGKGLVVAGTHSGSGKTTVALGLMAALKKRGLSVAPFKVGPDFIDPGHHGRITGKQSRNLDGWMLSKSKNLEIFSAAAADADIAVVEGVMGMYDGYDGRTEDGSTAQMSKWLGLPVLLVVNAGSMARSAAAVAFGFTRFDPECRFCGIVFNNIASPRHLEYVRQAVESAVTIPVVGGLARDSRIAIPERHLGLVTTEDHALSEQRVSALAELIENSLDLDALIENLPCFTPFFPDGKTSVAMPGDNPAKQAGERGQNKTAGTGARIGVARDNAFCFYYPENIAALEKNGARIVYFSPVNDRFLPEDLDGLYLGGGYPELHAKKLSENKTMRNAIRNLCEDGMPIYAECGGFMYLCERLSTRGGDEYDMAGCFPFSSRMQDRLAALGYREVKLLEKTPIGEKGLVARGHEFHYSTAEPLESDKKVRQVYAASDRTGADRHCPGYLVNRCLGGYVHLHFGSRSGIGRRFVSACEAYHEERSKNVTD